MYICSVCGYDQLESKQYYDDGNPTYIVCNCCGFESGFDDFDQGLTIEEYREKWIKDGCIWLIEYLKPANWIMEEQMKNIQKID